MYVPDLAYIEKGDTKTNMDLFRPANDNIDDLEVKIPHQDKRFGVSQSGRSMLN